MYFLISFLSTLLFSSNILFASDNIQCASNEYTILTMNGIFTDDVGARKNKDSLQNKLSPYYNNESLNFDYLLNPSHLAGFGDLLKSVYQGIFDSETVKDYDLVEMIDDASQKVTTQKILIVAHSQGNFYANSFYDVVTNPDGGVNPKSIGVYSVATPSGRVAGDGKWIISDTDKVISTLVGRLLSRKIMPPNISIKLGPNDDSTGHSFSDVYLKYKSTQIVSDINFSLSKLSVDENKDPSSPCINPPKITIIHKITGAIFAVADPIANITKSIISTAYSTIKNLTIKQNATANLAFENEPATENTNSETFIVVPKPIQKPIQSLALDKNITKELATPIVIKENTATSPTISIAVYRGGGGSKNIEQNSPNPAPTLSPTPDTLPEPNPTPAPDPVPIIDTTAPVITLNGKSEMAILLNSIYTELGATAVDDIDTNVEVFSSGEVDATTIGSYEIIYTTTDSVGNSSSKIRTIKVASYVYIPEFDFGLDESGQDWQIWAFNGSNVYDWSDTYVDGYLREQFKIQTIKGFYCSQCLQMGVFNHDPQKGFELKDLKISYLENNPQNNMNGETYQVIIQWDATGYTYSVLNQGIVKSTGRTDINGAIGKWVGWDGSHNNFKTFPSGNWIGTPTASPTGRTGGGGMVTKPYPVYIEPIISNVPNITLPTLGEFAGDGIDPTRGRDNLTDFTFEVVYSDPTNNIPQEIVLHVSNQADVVMQKIDNKNIYKYTSQYSTGDYQYYFSLKDNTGNISRVPENDLRFTVIPSTYKYIPKYNFGTENGDGNDWQFWAFNGSAVYNWSDTYVNGYLNQSFKIQASPPGIYCNQCMQMGIFNHDPQKGFEVSDLVISGLENNPQNNQNNKIYNVSMQWDSSGYTYIISHEGADDLTGHVDIKNITNDTWIGWDSTFNNFKYFPSGESFVVRSDGSSGGYNMVLTPRRITNF